MFKHSPSRNQRSKGFKIKHALQIALLLAVCIWLIYQVKHSHDKKKAFEENAAKLSERIESQHDIIKFGRKDLNPRVEKTASENERHGEEEETQEEEEEEIKHEEEEEIKHDEEEEQEEEENKPEESENEGRGDGDDEIDEHEQQRTEEEAKREDDIVDEEERDKHDNENEENEMEETQSNESEEKETEEETKESEEKVNEEENKESAEKENEEETKENGEETKESEEKENEKETKERENQIEEQDHDRNTQEAREEQYKGDDASSAVVRDTQAVSTEGESGVIGNSNEKEHVENLQATEGNSTVTTEGTSEQKDSYLKAGDGETTEGNSTVTATDGNSTVNATVIQEKGTEVNLSQLEDGSLPILTTKESIDLQEVNNSSTAENVGTPSASLQNGTDIITQSQTVETTSSNGGGDLDHKSVLLDQTENSNMTAEMLRSDSNSSLSTTTQNEDASKKESEESSSNSGTVVQEEQNAREEDSSKSSTTNENGDEDQNDNSETTTEEEDNSSSSTTNDNVDLIDNSTEDPLFPEVKEAQTDLGTLPEIETEGNNSEDVAAER